MYAICEMAQAKTDGHFCRLTDGIRRERVKGCGMGTLFVLVLGKM